MANKFQLAEQLRRALQMFAQTLTEDEAMEIATVYPEWKEGVAYKDNGFGGGSVDKDETTGPEDKEDEANPNTGAPVMNLTALAVVVCSAVFEALSTPSSCGLMF